MSNSTAHYCWVRVFTSCRSASVEQRPQQCEKSERDKKLAALDRTMQSVFNIVDIHPDHNLGRWSWRSAPRPPSIAAVGDPTSPPKGVKFTPPGTKDGLDIDANEAGQWWIDPATASHFNGTKIEFMPFYGTREQAMDFGRLEGRDWCAAADVCFLMCFQQ